MDDIKSLRLLVELKLVSQSAQMAFFHARAYRASGDRRCIDGVRQELADALKSMTVAVELLDTL
jgi:hypothetical protein